MTIPVFLALGSNLGDRGSWLDFARDGLVALPGLTMIRCTESVETLPLGGMEQPAYLNAMMLAAWRGNPDELLSECHSIEARAGRERGDAWQSRTLDIDLVRAGQLMCDLPNLTLPHPGLRDREFWARQIAELETDG